MLSTRRKFIIFFGRKHDGVHEGFIRSKLAKVWFVCYKLHQSPNTLPFFCYVVYCILHFLRWSRIESSGIVFLSEHLAWKRVLRLLSCQELTQDSASVVFVNKPLMSWLHNFYSICCNLFHLQAIRNNASFRVWILFFLVMCSLSLLFLDWYSWLKKTWIWRHKKDWTEKNLQSEFNNPGFAFTLTSCGYT